MKKYAIWARKYVGSVAPLFKISVVKQQQFQLGSATLLHWHIVVVQCMAKTTQYQHLCPNKESSETFIFSSAPSLLFPLALQHCVRFKLQTPLPLEQERKIRKFTE